LGAISGADDRAVLRLVIVVWLHRHNFRYIPTELTEEETEKQATTWIRELPPQTRDLEEEII
jgi:hypothetical protein